MKPTTLYHNDPTLTEREDFLAVQSRLEARGLSAIYGGGMASKGHGFWVQFYMQTLYNDGSTSRNPAFWMADDAAKLADLTDNELDALLHKPSPVLCGDSPSNDQDTKAWLACNYSWRTLADRSMSMKISVAKEARWRIAFYLYWNSDEISKYAAY